MTYILVALGAFFLTVLLTAIVRRVAFKLNIVDRPGLARKIHSIDTPLLGGVAIFFAYFIMLWIERAQLLSGSLSVSPWLGFFAGALVLLVGGVLDDKYNLSPRRQIIFPLLAIALLIAGGVSIDQLSNPFGGIISLSAWYWLSPLLITLWLLGMMYTTKLLDGVDGLVSGISAIGGLVIFLFTITTRYYQPDIAMAALILTAVCLGFLYFNFHPAKIFLGESGSLLLGYILGVLAIISGGKIAIALLVMGIPILDVAWTIGRRLYAGKNPFKSADRKHLHYRLLDLGLSQRQTVMVFYALALIFGLSGLFLQSQGKLFALLVLLFLMLVFIIFISSWRPRGKKKLLLHICCAPCGAYLSRDILSPRYDLTLYFYNPNLDSQEEFDRRLFYVKELATRYNWPLIVEPYEHQTWLCQSAGKEQDPERGARCKICITERLKKTALLAKRKGFALFASTLAISPYKDQAFIRQAGREIASSQGVDFLDEDFQANDAYRLSQNLAKELGFYRQKYCGCEYSR